MPEAGDLAYTVNFPSNSSVKASVTLTDCPGVISMNQDVGLTYSEDAGTPI